MRIADEAATKVDQRAVASQKKGHAARRECGDSQLGRFGVIHIIAVALHEATRATKGLRMVAHLLEVTVDVRKREHVRLGPEQGGKSSDRAMIKAVLAIDHDDEF